MKIYQVDAFTDKIFKGNPAGVCILPGQADDQWMQDIAMEMNLSETAFLYKQNDSFNLRWFTPEMEVDLCGHATLASAYILWETGVLEDGSEAVFSTKSGRLSAKKDGEYIILDFPAEEDEQINTPEELEKSLMVPILYAGRNRMDYIVEVKDEDTLKTLKPDFEIMKSLNTRGVIVTSPSVNPEYDFVSRFFAPGAGIPEDPVTGSAHCCLGPYWKKRLNKSELIAHQASKRGGMLKVNVCRNRVYIGGKAVTVFCAESSDTVLKYKNKDISTNANYIIKQVDDEIMQTSRTIIREFRKDDWQEIHQYSVDEDVIRFMSWGPNTEEDTKAFVDRAMKEKDKTPRKEYHFTIIEKTSGRLIGAVEIAPEGYQGKNGMLGYCYSKDTWGKGIGTEVVGALIEYGFNILGLHRIWANCDTENYASQRVLEKNGMRWEGCFKKKAFIKGEWRDDLHYAILREEWEVRRMKMTYDPESQIMSGDMGV